MFKKIFLCMVALAIIGVTALNLQYSLKKESVQSSISMTLKGSKTLASGENEPNWLRFFYMGTLNCWTGDLIFYPEGHLREYADFKTCLPDNNSHSACNLNEEELDHFGDCQ